MSWWKDLDEDSEERHYSVHTDEYKNYMIYHIMKKLGYRFNILHNLTSCIPFVELIDYGYVFSFQFGVHWRKGKSNNCFDWKEKEMKNIKPFIKDIRKYIEDNVIKDNSLQYKQ